MLPPCKTSTRTPTLDKRHGFGIALFGSGSSSESCCNGEAENEIQKSCVIIIGSEMNKAYLRQGSGADLEGVQAANNPPVFCRDRHSVSTSSKKNVPNGMN